MDVTGWHRSGILTRHLLHTSCIMKLTSLVLASVLLISARASADAITLFHNPDNPPHAFAAGDVRTALKARQQRVEDLELASLQASLSGDKIILARASDETAVAVYKTSGGGDLPVLGEQAYALRTTMQGGRAHWVFGGDDSGVMYGALQLAEYIRFSGLPEALNEDDTPHLRNRGIKFNIPFDKEAPTYFYDSRGTANRLAIRHVWDLSFWKTWFDEMARHRYNVLSLWNPHPFTSMVNLEEEYPGVAIQGVTGFDKDDNETQINDWSIDQKIAFWREVMKYGHERGFRIFIFTWNIFLSTAEGKHGIGKGPENQATRAYLHKSTRRLFETYPHLTGMGLTVGENMDTDDTNLKEEWAWDAYGSAVLEVAKANPERQITFIHRLLQSDLSTTAKYFQPLIDQPNVRFDLSHKYSNAHAHAAVKPVYWARKKLEPQLEKLGITSWLTIRNDDWYFLHWAEPQFIRDYIANFPTVGKYIDGIYIGPDGWAFSRVFTSKDPLYEEQNMLDIQRTWLMQKIWGRIAYNPAVGDELFTRHLQARYPGVSSEALFEAWTKASRAVRLFNEQVTGDWSLDFHWMPERWTAKDEGYRTLTDLLETEPMDGSPLVGIKKTARGDVDDDERSALANADDIQRLANEAQASLDKLSVVTDRELAHNLSDIQSMIHLALVGAHKIRAGVAKEQNDLPEARAQMLTAYRHWYKYADLMDSRYIGVDMQRNHHFKSWHQLDPEVLRDLTLLGGPVSLDPTKPYPWVRIHTPANLSEVEEPARVEVKINAAAENNAAVKVELLRNGEVVHSSTETSFSHTLSDLPLGDHTLLARVTDASGARSEHAIALTTFTTTTRNTLPWMEAFSQPDGTTEDSGRSTWIATRKGGKFSVKDQALIINDKGGEGEFRTGEIDISGGPVKISLDLRPQGVDSRDYVRLYAIVDGGPERQLAEHKEKSDEPATLTASVEGSKLVLVIKAEVTSDDETFHLDNLSVTR